MDLEFFSLYLDCVGCGSNGGYSLQSFCLSASSSMCAGPLPGLIMHVTWLCVNNHKEIIQDNGAGCKSNLDWGTATSG